MIGFFKKYRHIIIFNLTKNILYCQKPLFFSYNEYIIIHIVNRKVWVKVTKGGSFLSFDKKSLNLIFFPLFRLLHG